MIKVRFLRLLFVLFQSRTPTSITIEVMGTIETYDLLAIFDFNNVRKRMSVSLLLYFILLQCIILLSNALYI